MSITDMAHIVRVAREVLSEDGTNPEYDRAVVEMTCDLLSLSMDSKEGVALLLGVPANSPSMRVLKGLPV